MHAVVDALGNPLKFELTPGQAHDSVKGYEILSQFDLSSREILADRAYDTDTIRTLLKEQNAIAVIPSKKKCRVKQLTT
ncbi:transposase [Saccharibacillus qingshengii]|uniref:transposase n=1 Tax=Saccharibacillus qingshengii TaxID=1763540 RepID=UPI003CCDD708